MEIQEHHVRARAGDDLRRTLASGAVQRSASLREVKESLGHSSPAMVIRYAHLSPEHLRRAVARLDGGRLPTLLPLRPQRKSQRKSLPTS